MVSVFVLASLLSIVQWTDVRIGHSPAQKPSVAPHFLECKSWVLTKAWKALHASLLLLLYFSPLFPTPTSMLILEQAKQESASGLRTDCCLCPESSSSFTPRNPLLPSFNLLWCYLLIEAFSDHTVSKITAPSAAFPGPALFSFIARMCLWRSVYVSNLFVFLPLLEY